ncbi:MAG: aldo/keto reductase [Chloroflexi bacterium]|nr:aldo/keto reductase [Chloroflexota bacterium]
MQYRTLGKTDSKVSVMALGCWPFAGGAVWGDQDDKDSIATVHAALDAGINFFDTAEGYEEGKSERVLGQGLKGRRHEAVIATKVSPNHLGAEDVMLACERSLRNLATDYIDLYQIHWPSRAALPQPGQKAAMGSGGGADREVPLRETLEALEKLKRQGKIRTIGVSNFGPKDLSAAIDLSDIVTNQIPYSLLWRAIEHEIKPISVKNRTGIICYSPLAQGLLTGRYKSADDVPEGLARTRLFSNKRPMARHEDPGCESEVFEAIKKIQQVADRVGEPMAAVALAWIRQRRGVTSFLVGARKPDELKMNLPALDVKLDSATSRELARITQPIKRAIGKNADPWNSNNRMR